MSGSWTAAGRASRLPYHVLTRTSLAVDRRRRSWRMTRRPIVARIVHLVALSLVLGAVAHAQVPAATPAALQGVDAGG